MPPPPTVSRLALQQTGICCSIGRRGRLILPVRRPLFCPPPSAIASGQNSPAIHSPTAMTRRKKRDNAAITINRQAIVSGGVSLGFSSVPLDNSASLIRQKGRALAPWAEPGAACRWRASPDPSYVAGLCSRGRALQRSGRAAQCGRHCEHPAMRDRWEAPKSGSPLPGRSSRPTLHEPVGAGIANQDGGQVELAHHSRPVRLHRLELPLRMAAICCWSGPRRSAGRSRAPAA